jgi:hypothetical protein
VSGKQHDQPCFRPAHLTSDVRNREILRGARNAVNDGKPHQLINDATALSMPWICRYVALGTIELAQQRVG